MGGDEFVLMLKNNRAKDVLKQLSNVIKNKNEKGVFKYNVSYSVGMAEYINDGKNDIKEAIKLADDEMYEMKSRRKNI